MCCLYFFFSVVWLDIDDAHGLSREFDSFLLWIMDLDGKGNDVLFFFGYIIGNFITVWHFNNYADANNIGFEFDFEVFQWHEI